MTSNLRLAVCIGLLLPAAASAQTPPREEALVDFFEKKVRPVLIENCYNCHSASTNSKGGLRVDDRNGLVVGGNRGPAIIPGQPEKSLLLQAVRHTHAKLKMPANNKKLTDEEIADLARWIKDGAAWPKVRVPASLSRPNPEFDKLRKTHWAWQPLRAVTAPAVKDAAWPRDDVDRFVLAKLEEKGLKPVGDADPATLIRRVTFDLTGLPPTADETVEFIKACEGSNAKRATAYERLVDRLLASPAFGEHWGRYWLDLARFGESTGSARNLPYPHAWRYRDYVIDAFNSDRPYDHFVREQVAGDLLPFKSQDERDRQLTATGFLAIGVKDVNQRFKVRFVMDNIDEQIDAMSRTVLALTASCARCHDHKFDPISTSEYYALAGIFHSSDNCGGLRNKMGGGGLDYYDPAMLLSLGGSGKIDPKLADKIAQTKKDLTAARAELTSLADDPMKSKAGPERQKQMTAVQKRIQAIQADLVNLTDPAKSGPVAMGVRDARKVGDTEIRIRGEAEKLGPTVPRGFLKLLDFPGAPKVNPDQSGRLELANWLTHENNPLTPRVMVNRVWKHLFGQGIVASVDNFGVTGNAPTHPDLLDHLATRFMKGEPGAGGEPGASATGAWSVKKLIRTLVLTRAYQLGGETTAANVAADPGNQLIWRHSPRRLTAEEIRDAMLAASGKLDRTRPKGSAAMDMKVIELSNVSPLAKQLQAAADKSVQRSVYLPLLRTLTPRSLEVFDFAEQGLVVGSRDATTVPTQALYLLNDPFVRQQSQALAGRLLPTSLDEGGRISMAYQTVLGRAATEKETARAEAYLRDYEADARKEGVKDARTAAWASFCQALLASAEFRYVR
jgi:cytochrome c553